MDEQVIKSHAIIKVDNIVKGNRPRGLKARKKRTTQKTPVRYSEIEIGKAHHSIIPSQTLNSNFFFDLISASCRIRL